MLKFETRRFAELNSENNVEIWSIDALESSKRYKMCKDVNVKHLSKKIIGVYTMHYDWSALEIVISNDALVSILSDNVMTDFKKISLVLVDRKFTCQRWTLLQDLCLDNEMILHTNQ